MRKDFSNWYFEEELLQPLEYKIIQARLEDRIKIKKLVSEITNQIDPTPKQIEMVVEMVYSEIGKNLESLKLTENSPHEKETTIEKIICALNFYINNLI